MNLKNLKNGNLTGKVSDARKSKKEKTQDWMLEVFEETFNLVHRSPYEDGTVRYNSKGQPYEIKVDVSGRKQNELVEKARKLGLKQTGESFGAVFFKGPNRLVRSITIL